MFDLQWTEEAEKIYFALEQHALGIKAKREKQQKVKALNKKVYTKQVKKTLQYLRRNPRHPGLHTHSYSSLEHPWSHHKKYLRHMCRIILQLLIEYFGAMIQRKETLQLFQ